MGDQFVLDTRCREGGQWKNGSELEGVRGPYSKHRTSADLLAELFLRGRSIWTKLPCIGNSQRGGVSRCMIELWGRARPRCAMCDAPLHRQISYSITTSLS
jgi:hypothetical protein